MNDRGASMFALDERGQLWIGNDALYEFEQGSWHVARDLERGVRGQLIDLFVDGKGSLWAVTPFQLLRYDGEVWEVINPDRQTGLGFRDVWPLHEMAVCGQLRVREFIDSNGQVWTALSTPQTQGLAQIGDNPDRSSISICEASDGRFVAGAGGWCAACGGMASDANTRWLMEYPVGRLMRLPKILVDRYG